MCNRTKWLAPGGYTPDDLADEVVDLSVPPAPPKAPPVEDDDEGIDLGAFDIGGEG